MNIHVLQVFSWPCNITVPYLPDVILQYNYPGGAAYLGKINIWSINLYQYGRPLHHHVKGPEVASTTFSPENNYLTNLFITLMPGLLLCCLSASTENKKDNWIEIGSLRTLRETVCYHEDQCTKNNCNFRIQTLGLFLTCAGNSFYSGRT